MTMFDTDTCYPLDDDVDLLDNFFHVGDCMVERVPNPRQPVDEADMAVCMTHKRVTSWTSLNMKYLREQRRGYEDCAHWSSNFMNA